MDIFDANALDLIGRISLGIPRVINNVCDNALLIGYAEGYQTITRDVIEEVIIALDITPNETTTSDPAEFNVWGAPVHHTAMDGSQN
jgi:hypothetical protein